MSDTLNLSKFKMPAHRHDIPDGHIDFCQVCGSKNLALVIDLGHQPLCDTLLTTEQLNEPEKIYPLRLWRCQDCTLTQIDYMVPGAELYAKSYPYRSGITREVVEHMNGMAAECCEVLKLAPGSHVLDIGCNDGTLLKALRDNGMKPVGVDPTDVGQFARDAGIEVYQEFFDEKLAKQIVAKHGKAKLVTATNVFAHMNTLGEVMRGIKALLADDGSFVCEVHYLGAILEGAQYDSIYHEHVRTYSFKSLVVLFHLYGMTVTRAVLMGRYSGTIRVYVSNQPGAVQDKSVANYIAEEDRRGFSKPEIYQEFVRRVEQSRADLLALAYKAKAEGKSFVGNSCPGRCSTLMNYVGLDNYLMPYICEQPASLKKGMYLPGKHIPVVENTILEKAQPDYIVLLAWHLAEPIIKELRGRGIKSKLVMPLPEVRIIDN